MRLNAEECWARLGDAGHGVLATVHQDRGVDAVPVVYAVAAGDVILPIDTVKAKSTTRLQRLANLEADPRCVLLVEHYDADWSKLWWVRAHATAMVTDAVLQPLTDHFEQYRAAGAVAAAVVLTVTEITGWQA